MLQWEHKAGFELVRVAQIEWEDRRNVDNWPSRATCMAACTQPPC